MSGTIVDQCFLLYLCLFCFLCVFDFVGLCIIADIHAGGGRHYGLYYGRYYGRCFCTYSGLGFSGFQGFRRPIRMLGISAGIGLRVFSGCQGVGQYECWGLLLSPRTHIVGWLSANVYFLLDMWSILGRVTFVHRSKWYTGGLDRGTCNVQCANRQIVTAQWSFWCLFGATWPLGDKLVLIIWRWARFAVWRVAGEVSGGDSPSKSCQRANWQRIGRGG